MPVTLRILIRVFTLAWIFAGMSYFYLLADFNYNPFSLSNSDYYFWDKTAMVLVIVSLLTPCKRMDKLFYVLLSFCIIRALYEIPALRNLFELDSDVMFLILCLHIGALIAVAISDAIINREKTFEKNLDELSKNSKK